MYGDLNASKKYRATMMSPRNKLPAINVTITSRSGFQFLNCAGPDRTSPLNRLYK